jgi:hypothetical protein
MDLKLYQEMFFDYFSGPNYWGTIVKFYVYKNPTIDEWNDFIPKLARGWISPEGNLYMEGNEDARYDPEAQIIHTDLLKSLVDKGVQGLTSEYVKNYFKNDDMLYNIKRNGLLVQRIGREKAIMFTETMNAHVAHSYPTFSNNARVLYSRVKKNYPYLSFKFWNIGNENDEEELNPWRVNPAFNEEFFDYTICFNGKFYTYINPTVDEIKKFICNGSRGYIAPSGDLYMEGYEKMQGGNIIHKDLFRALADKGIVTPEYAQNWFTRHSEESILREGIAVQRYNDTAGIALSESIYYTDRYAPSIRMLFDKCKRRGNTYWDFISVKISYLEP